MEVLSMRLMRKTRLGTNYDYVVVWRGADVIALVHHMSVRVCATTNE